MQEPARKRDTFDGLADQLNRLDTEPRHDSVERGQILRLLAGLNRLDTEPRHDHYLDPFKALASALFWALAYEGLVYFEESDSRRKSARARLKACWHLPDPDAATAAYDREAELHDADRARRKFHKRLEKIAAKIEREAHQAAREAGLSAPGDRAVIMEVTRTIEAFAGLGWDEDRGRAVKECRRLMDKTTEVNHALDSLAIHARGVCSKGQNETPEVRGRRPKKPLDPEMKNRIIRRFESGTKSPETIFGLVGAEDHGMTVEDVSRTISSYCRRQRRLGKANDSSRTKRR